ncbi:unnamed protein product [Lactuca virosa]|uniref:Glutathione S-transferase C-terminal domain-containing protein n=1 Tax=Lactuca virosa TaxID=75947 RepID=A0AAU9NEZ4_9ASTR|nr:unnamed protein product [Lactuca virosa]
MKFCIEVRLCSNKFGLNFVTDSSTTPFPPVCSSSPFSLFAFVGHERLTSYKTEWRGRAKLKSGMPPFIILPCETLNVEEVDEILRYFCHIGVVDKLYDRDSISRAETRELFHCLQRVHACFSGPDLDFDKACMQFDHQLQDHDFLVGDLLSLADIVLWSYLAGAGKKWDSKKYKYLVRFYNLMSELYSLDKVREAYLAAYPVQEDSKMDATEVDLPDAETGKPG